jgi:hypothetical protein
MRLGKNGKRKCGDSSFAARESEAWNARHPEIPPRIIANFRFGQYLVSERDDREFHLTLAFA